MATAAQTIANQANALHSTGPKTPEGKDRAARNNTRHGLTLGVLVIAGHEKDAHTALAAELREQVCPCFCQLQLAHFDALPWPTLGVNSSPWGRLEPGPAAPGGRRV